MISRKTKMAAKTMAHISAAFSAVPAPEAVALPEPVAYSAEPVSEVDAVAPASACGA